MDNIPEYEVLLQTAKWLFEEGHKIERISVPSRQDKTEIEQK
ncbi:MAG: hypothetical protein ACRENZ_06130 [Thermodesulfobacteriota bacterium]